MCIKIFPRSSLFTEKIEIETKTVEKSFYGDVPKFTKISNYFLLNKIYISRKLTLVATRRWGLFFDRYSFDDFMRKNMSIARNAWLNRQKIIFLSFFPPFIFLIITKYKPVIVMLRYFRYIPYIYKLIMTGISFSLYENTVIPRDPARLLLASCFAYFHHQIYRKFELQYYNIIELNESFKMM